MAGGAPAVKAGGMDPSVSGTSLAALGDDLFVLPAGKPFAAA